jgi:death on curing protein
MNPVFLTTEEVLALHADQIRRYGGSAGIREIGLLSSALGAPEATFDGDYLHPTLFEMAAAYLFHLAKNHPFVDGNKRVALAAALAFLWMNGYEVVAEPSSLGDLVLAVATGESSKAEAAAFFRRMAVEVA